MFCSKCGTTLTAETTFCSNCGSKVENNVSPPFPPLQQAAPKAKSSNKVMIISLIIIILSGISIGAMLWLQSGMGTTPTTARNERSNERDSIADARTGEGNSGRFGRNDDTAAEYIPATPAPPEPAPEPIPEIFTPAIDANQIIEDFLMQMPTIFANAPSGWELTTGERRYFGIPLMQGEILEDGRISLGIDWDNVDWDNFDPIYDRFEEIIVDEPSFQLGWIGGELSEWGWVQWEPIITYNVPDIFYIRFRDSWENTGFYDSNFNRIVNEPWMLWNNLYATSFSLWNLGNDVPDILVEYWGHYEGSGDGGAPASLFRYINGEFVRIYYFPHHVWDWGGGLSDLSPSWFPWQGYYWDEHNNLIGYFYGISEAMPVYAHITFSDNFANMDVIARGQIDWESVDWENPDTFRLLWNNYRTGEFNFEAEPHRYEWDMVGDNWVRRETTHIMPGTNIILTPIRPLTSLQESVAESVTRRLVVEGLIRR